MNRGVLAGLCLLLFCGLAWGQDSLKPREVPLQTWVATPDTAGYKPAFERIARAWQEGKAETLAVFLGEGKVSIALPRVVGGVLSRDQAEYVLRDMFKYNTTEKFEFVKYDTFVSEGVAGIAEWSYRSSKGGPATKDRVSVWLVKEGREAPRWVIKEIKAAGP
jgi:hypothetical protein